MFIEKNRYTCAKIQYILVERYCSVRTDWWIRPVTVSVGSNTPEILDRRDHIREFLIFPLCCVVLCTYWSTARIGWTENFEQKIRPGSEVSLKNKFTRRSPYCKSDVRFSRYYYTTLVTGRSHVCILPNDFNP